jgi:hypothetical protein
VPSARLQPRRELQSSRQRLPPPSGCGTPEAISRLQKLGFFCSLVFCARDEVRQTSRTLRTSSVVVPSGQSHPPGKGTRKLQPKGRLFRDHVGESALHVCGPCSQICCLPVRSGLTGCGGGRLWLWYGHEENLLASLSLWDLQGSGLGPGLGKTLCVRINV